MRLKEVAIFTGIIFIVQPLLKLIVSLAGLPDFWVTVIVPVFVCCIGGAYIIRHYLHVKKNVRYDKE